MTGFSSQEGRLYIVGTKVILKCFEQELLSSDSRQVHEGLEVRLCAAPDGAEVFILCRSAQRSVKERRYTTASRNTLKRTEEDRRRLSQAPAETGAIA